MKKATVKYEKGELYSMGELPILPDELLCDVVDALLKYKHKEQKYTPLKTFSVTIEISEDEES